MGLHRDFSFILGISNFMLLSLHNGQKPHSAEILSKSSRNADLSADMPNKNKFVKTVPNSPPFIFRYLEVSTSFIKQTRDLFTQNYF